MTKQQVVSVSPVAKAVAVNSNKEVVMEAATSGTVTLTVAEYEALKAKSAPKEPGAKKQNSTIKWICTLSRQEIRESKAPGQMKPILNAVRDAAVKLGQTKDKPIEVTFGQFGPTLVDVDSADCMHYGSSDYKSLDATVDADRIVLNARNVEIVDYYGTDVWIAKSKLSVDKLKVR